MDVVRIGASVNGALGYSTISRSDWKHISTASMQSREETAFTLAVQANKVGYALIRGDQLVFWGTSTDAHKSDDTLFEFVEEKLRYFQPDIFLTDDNEVRTRKGKRARALIQIAKTAAQEVSIDHVPVERSRNFKNKYDEAIAIAKEYPELRKRVPKRRMPWQQEPTDVVLFEALSLWCTYNGIELPIDKPNPDDPELGSFGSGG